ncbi:NusG domain II [Fontimonas thermophila]|uniref:NusG domain II n=1 Tax=Fontimonas thermophila TaxID=1076937 RepID=A0A1I2JLP6_9GAMM|nr:NusG domain II-containing protein [Fontimonas thermophila]SFF54803.1 NusG domain II [Fontimonas thermophila]
MTRADVIAIGLAAAAVGATYAHFWQPAMAATQFEVRIAGQPSGRYALDGNRDILVEGRLGPSRLRIENGRVRFIASPCRNKVCVHSGWLSHGGDAAACLPNRVSISLLGDAEASVDAVSF